MNMNINKSDWIKIKLNDVCEWYQKNIPNDEQINFGIEYYVTANHIDSDSIKFDRYSELADGQKGPTITKHFEKGDLLLSTRSVALRKAALAPVDGVTGEKLLVLRVKPESLLLRELMPFVFQSIDFWKYAQNSASGSVNKFTSWTKIREYEFLLPPKDQQAQLAKLLWAMDEVIEKEKEVFYSIDKLFKTKAKYISDNHIHEGQYKKIKEVCLIKDNMRKPLNSSQRDKMKGDIPYYGANGLVGYLNDFIFDEDLVLVAEDGGNFNEFYAKNIAYRVSGKSWVNNHAHVLVAKDEFLSNEWLYYSLVHKNILKYIIGSTRLKLNKSELERVTLWIPSEKLMKTLTLEMDEINYSKMIANEKLKSSQSLQKSIINQIF